MTLHILTPADYRTMPWKNGQGITHEIAVERTEEDLRSGGFVWRMSMAEVGVSAPFSQFPHCDRTIVLLEGEGMILDSGSNGYHELTRPFVPYSFRGEWQTEGRLIGGPCRDFNLMVDRTRARAECAVLSLSKTAQTLHLPGEPCALLTLRGTVVGMAEPSQQSFELPARHTLLTKSGSAQPRPQTLTVTAGEEQTCALLISVTRRPQTSDAATDGEPRSR